MKALLKTLPYFISVWHLSLHASYLMPLTLCLSLSNTLGSLPLFVLISLQ